MDNILRSTSSSSGSLALVGDDVVVKKENRFGRIRKWNGVVVSEAELLEGRRLMEMNELDDETLGSPCPPGSVSGVDAPVAPPRKKARQDCKV